MQLSEGQAETTLHISLLGESVLGDKLFYTQS